MDRHIERCEARIRELEQQLQTQMRESAYYRRLAKAAGDQRLRDAEGYSRLVSHLKERIWLAETQHAALLELHRKIERISVTDDLTQALSRRGCTERFQQSFASCQETLERADATRHCFCALVDLDGLADINDDYGYPAGDELLRRVGGLLRRSDRLRQDDLIGRFAGKVFILALPDRPESDAMSALTRLLEQIGRFRFRVLLDTKVQVGASIGVSAVGRQDGSVFDVIERADAALRQTRAPGAERLIYRAS